MTTGTNGPLNVGFLSPHNPYDARCFSGTSFYAAQALRRDPRVNLRILGGHRTPGLAQKLLGRGSPKISSVSLNDFAGLDVVIGLVASQLYDPIANDLDVPFIHVTDATPAFLRECYGWDIPADIEQREARVAATVRAVVYSSTEMADRGEREFGIVPHSIPFGVNIGLPTRADYQEKPALDKPNLLVVGNDWRRKGGDIAVAAFRRLRETGLDAHLTIVGAAPVALSSDPNITVAGYLNKNKPAQAAKLARIYAASHLLVLPTRADCTPMVVAEAMAFGAPIVATDVGGIPTLLGGSGTGQLVALNADADEWARHIAEVLSDKEAYQMMADTCIDRAQNRLTWRAWCNDMLEKIETLGIRNGHVGAPKDVAA